MKKVKAVFLDRDGVINEYPGDLKYVTRLEDFHLLDGVGAAIKRITDSCFEVFVISNQAGVSKGIYSKTDLDLITSHMLYELGKSGARINDVFYCIHTSEEDCQCRKPKTGLVHMAIDEAGTRGKIIDINQSYFVGDTIRDIETGKKAGLKTILVFSGKEKPQNRDSWKLQPDFTARSLSEAADKIILKKTC